MKEIYNFFKFQLNEILLHTLSPDKAKYKIDSHIYFINSDGLDSYDDYRLSFEGHLMIIEFKNKYSYEQILSILSEIFSTGYFVSQYFISSKTIKNFLILLDNEFLKYWNPSRFKKTNKYNKNITSFKLVCEPKWDNSVKVTNDIYHVTDSENTENILKYGLIPKSGKKKSYYPERIYFSLNIKDSDIILKSLKNFDKLKKRYNINELSTYDLLKINTDDLKSFNFDGKQYNVVFYKDTNSENGIYSYDRITPENIELFKKNI